MDTIAVVIPTWQRAELLRSALGGVASQDRPPSEVLVVGRDGDAAARRVVDEFATSLPTRWVTVDRPGHVPPVIVGLGAARTDIVVFLDDDCVPDATWLGQLVEPFADPAIACVGGGVSWKDYRGPLAFEAGQLTWYGRYRPLRRTLTPRPVAGVAECNWAWRRHTLEELTFDPAFEESDAILYGLDLCLQAIRLGHKVVHVPGAHVADQAGPRDPSLDRGDQLLRARNFNRNMRYIQRKHGTAGLRALARVWELMIGDRSGYGLATALIDLPRVGPRKVASITRAAHAGRQAAGRAMPLATASQRDRGRLSPIALRRGAPR
ncbi:MAG TPA: glycosyltransferase [Acidimicrobiales bacterium]|nr:glycosyltransferase [Acidimicrobiales bacterium]